MILSASGLGPVDGFESGVAFPADRILAVNSPLGASVGGRSARVVNKLGWPGLVDIYRVEIQVPDGIPARLASVRLTDAWILGPEFWFPVQ